MLDRILQPEHLIVILLICLLIFGPSKLPGLGKGLGEAFRGFKDGMKAGSDDATTHGTPAKTEADLPNHPK